MGLVELVIENWDWWLFML